MRTLDLLTPSYVKTFRKPSSSSTVVCADVPSDSRTVTTQKYNQGAPRSRAFWRIVNHGLSSMFRSSSNSQGFWVR